MDTVKGLQHEDVFVLHAPFKPTPLLGILKMKGYSNSSERKSSDHWVTTFVHKKIKPVQIPYLQRFYPVRPQRLNWIRFQVIPHFPARAVQKKLLWKLSSIHLLRLQPSYLITGD
ncbi:hypothetical protein [Paenibacillus amylolyticus]|uniref:hypothetical protein n=1 Tax=Paenibacillus amylolyticus TaxID=1451 RepID=UPI003D808E55